MAEQLPLEVLAAANAAAAVENAGLKAEVANLKAEVVDLKAEVAGLKAEVAALPELRAELELLKTRLGQNSGNSNKPPSTDPPWKKPAAGKGAKASKGKRKGRRGFWRSIPETFDREAEVGPEVCLHCKAALEGCRTTSRHNHYVTDLSEDRPTKQVTRHIVHTVRCGRCGKTTTAARPNGGLAFGPVFHSWVGLLRSRYRISVSQVKELCWDLWQIRISEGAIIGCQDRLAVALEGLHEEARVHIHKAAVRHADETTWFVNHKLSWVWVGVASFVSVFLIRPHRNREAAVELLGEPVPGQVTISDRYAVYNAYAGQVCWAHLMRPYEALAESTTPELSSFGSRVVAAITEMLTVSRYWRNGTYEDAEYRPRIEACVATVMNLLETEGASHTNGRIREPCKSMLKDKARFFLFVESKDIEPTNNVAERTVRPLVMLRKQTQGTHSDLGTKFVECSQTVVASCLRQGRRILDVFQDALRGIAVSILPTAIDTG